MSSISLTRISLILERRLKPFSIITGDYILQRLIGSKGDLRTVSETSQARGRLRKSKSTSGVEYTWAIARQDTKSRTIEA